MFSELKRKDQEERFLASHIIRMMKDMSVKIDMKKLKIQYLHEFMRKWSKYKDMDINEIFDDDSL